MVNQPIKVRNDFRPAERDVSELEIKKGVIQETSLWSSITLTGLLETSKDNPAI